MKRDIKTQKRKHADDLQPYPLPQIKQADRDHHAADDMHGAGSESADQKTQQIRCAVSGKKADIFKRGKADRSQEGANDRGSLIRLKYQKEKQDR